MNIHRLISPLLVAGALACASITSQAGVLVEEGFESPLLPGWAVVDESTPGGSSGWFVGNSGVFPAQAGSPNSYAAANFLGAPPGGEISNWLMMPVVSLDTATSLQFALRLLGEEVLGLLDTVEVHLSTSGTSTDVGDFSLLQSYASTTDTGWVDETINISAFAPGTTGRLAFRYVVANTDTAGSYIGIDSVLMSTRDGTVPEPSPAALLALALVGMAASRRRR